MQSPAHCLNERATPSHNCSERDGFCFALFVFAIAASVASIELVINLPL